MSKFYSLTEENITDMLAALSLEPEWLRMAQENPQLLVVMADSERLRSAPYERPKCKTCTGKIPVHPELLVALLERSHPNGKFYYSYHGIAPEVMEDLYQQAKGMLK